MQLPRIGILGDGQLAKMLVEAASPLGLFPSIYSDSEDTALSNLSSNIVKGERNDVSTLSRFFASIDVVIFESEFFNRSVIEKALEALPKQPVFIPSLQTMDCLGDKLNQKKVLKDLKIPTAPFLTYSKEKSIESWLEEVKSEFGSVFVLKWGRLGYDGKGVLVVTSANVQQAMEFCGRAVATGVSLYAEKKIKFKRELAITGCYSTKKEFAAYPLVVSIQKNGVCVQVVGPGTALGLKAKHEVLAKTYAEKLAKKLELFGSFSIELFETKDGKLLVNEIAPRVHNSAHYTQDAAPTSQFENHFRAALGIKLGDTHCAPAFSMVNLLGPAGVSCADVHLQKPVLEAGLHLHWYAKSKVKPGRKLGHLNGVAASKSGMKMLIKVITRVAAQWDKDCKKELGHG